MTKELAMVEVWPEIGENSALCGCTRNFVHVKVESTTSPEGEGAGVKLDQGKTPYHLLPPELLEGVGQVLDFGTGKYTARNWELGMAWSRSFSALMRHMWAWWRGQDADPETGMSHLWHAGCCLAFLIAYEQRGVGEDDRPKENDNA